MKRIVILVVLVGLLGSGGYRLWLDRQAEEDGDGLTLYGNVDIRDVVLGFRAGGRIAEMRFEEGDTVRAGQVMAVLDKGPAEDDLDLAQAELRAAEATLRKFERGSRPEEIEQARAQLREREAAFENAQRIYLRRADLVRKGTVSQQEYEDALSARDEAKARLATARETLNLALQGFREEDVMEARATVDAAEAKVALARTRLADTAIEAPADGTVLTRVREPGAIVAQGAPVYSLSLDKPVWIRTYVDEPRLGHIHPGMAVKVFTDSRPQRPYRGQVGYISPQAEFTPKNVETTELRTDLVYRLRVIVADPDKGLRQGMPVTVRVEPADDGAGPGHGQ